MVKQQYPSPNFIQVGKYRKYTLCRFCSSNKLEPVINLGYVPLAGGFLTTPTQFEQEKFFPLELSFCKDCFLLQSINVIDADTLFQNYFYHSSAIGTLANHFETVAEEIKKSLNGKKKPFVVEIGCNDGVLTKEFLKRKIRTLGIDPATNIVQPLIAQKLPLINDYFSEKLAKKIINEHSQADVITSFNVMAHIENMHDIVNGIKLLLKNDGYLLFETHYIGNLLNETQYDMIYHEHQYYYSLLTLQNFFTLHDMEIFDVKPIQIHAGSMRYYVQHKNGGRRISSSIKELADKERRMKLNTAAPYITFAKKISKTKKNLLLLLQKLKKEQKKIVGYGASGRGTIIMNYCNLDEKYLDSVIDDAPAKHGAYVPGTHQKIVSSDILKTEQKPDYAILFAWSFWEEIKKKNEQFLKNGGAFIIPLPNIKIINNETK